MNNILHQLLAVEKDLVNKAMVLMKETIDTLTKKQEHFTGLSKIYEPYDEEGTKFPDEVKEVVTTVREKLDYLKTSIINAIDATISKEETNNTTREKLIVNGKEYGELSPTSLLALEKYLVQIRNVYKNIPTLDPVKKWSMPENLDREIYETDEETTYRTEKMPKVIELSPATKEHPAQTQLIQLDKQVGVWKKIHKSGKLTPKQKSELLERIEELIIVVKKTRAKANQTEVNNIKIGKDILKYIHGE